MKRNLFLVILFTVAGIAPGVSQEKQKFLSVSGYISDMQTVTFDSLSGPFIIENLIHNRINLKGYAGKSITFAAEFRNRLFTGDLVRSGPAYAEMIGTDPGKADMSWNIVNEQSFFINTTIDRLWIDFNHGKFQARVGRQRVNWGQTLIWNPNDIFNAYSFFDFDYPERPGSDAIRLQYYPGSASVIELTVKADHDNRVTAAGLYRFSRWGFDIQFLGGYFNSEDIVAGTGWSGALGSFSFRGEASWFQPSGNSAGKEATGLITAGVDKVFRDNSSAQIQVMFCNNPVKTDLLSTLFLKQLTAKDLAFSKVTAFGQYSYQINPLITIAASAMWFPDLKGYFGELSFGYSLAENADLSLFFQHFAGEISRVRSEINIGFLRIKLSF